MTEDDIEAFMAEEPGGENHGYKRNSFGSWSPLEVHDEPPHRRQVFSQSNHIHGFAYGYQTLKCRCVECRAWKAASRGDAKCLDPSVCNYPSGRCVEPSRCSFPKSGNT